MKGVGNGISWTIYKSFAPGARQIAMPVPHHCRWKRKPAESNSGGSRSCSDITLVHIICSASSSYL